MGVLEQITGPLAQQVSERGTATVVAAGFAAFIVLSVVLNALSQVLFKNPNEPPMVFHLFPVIGSTVTYGMDPYGFFFKCRARVRYPKVFTLLNQADCGIVWRCFYLYPTWKENYRIPRATGQRFYSQWEIEGCQCGGNLHCLDHPCLWKRCRL
jgi:hypothetical protein